MGQGNEVVKNGSQTDSGSLQLLAANRDFGHEISYARRYHRVASLWKDKRRLVPNGLEALIATLRITGPTSLDMTNQLPEVFRSWSPQPPVAPENDADASPRRRRRQRQDPGD